MIEQTVRYAPDVGHHAALEDVLHRQRYHALLARLMHDHRGPTLAHHFDASWKETLRRTPRDRNRPFGHEEIAGWYCPRDLPGWPRGTSCAGHGLTDRNTERLLAELD